MNRRKPLLRLGVALAALALVAGACGSSKKSTNASSGGSSSSGTKATIAFVGALTGDNANLGINIRNGAKVAVQEANAKGDVNITLKEFDTQGSPDQASTLKDQFISDNSILGVVGPAFSGETKAVLPSLNEAGLVMISASATNTALPTVVPGQKVFHRVIPDDDVQGQGLTDYVTKKLKAKSAAYIDDNSDYGKGLAGGTKDLLEKAGVKTAVTDSIDPKAQDFSSAVNKVNSAKPDLVFYGGYYAEAGRLAKQLKDAGVKAQFLSGDGTLDKGFIESAGAQGAEGAQITCACKIATADSPGKLGDFAKKYKEINKVDPGTYSTEGYDATNIFIAGIRAGNTTRAKLLNYVETLAPYQGVGKTIEFQDNGNVKQGDVFVYEAKNGKLTELGTTASLTG